MADQIVFVPIVNGNTITVTGIYNQTTQSGTVCIMPFIDVWTNGAPVATSNTFPVLDASALINTGSLVTQAGSLVTSNNSIVTALAGTLLTAASFTPIALDIGTVTTGGTAVNALSAGHAAKGGFLNNPNSYSIYYAQIGTAGTTAGGSTIALAAGSTAGLMPSAAAVSVNAGTSGALISGYGFT